MLRDTFCGRPRSVALAAMAILVAFGCGRDRPAPMSSANDATTGTPLKSPSVVRPMRASLHRTIELPGTVESFEQTVLFAKVAGFVRQVNVDIGQKVKGPARNEQGQETSLGEVLVEIAVPELEEEGKQKIALIQQADAEVEQSRKSLASAETNVALLEAQVVEAKAGLGRAEALHDRWSSETRRLSGLVDRGVIDSQTVEEAENQLRAAQATLDEAQAHVLSAEAATRKAAADRGKAAADIAAATARCEVAKAELRRLEAMLGYTKIRAPFDGVITKRTVSTGDFLQPGDAKNRGIVTIARLDPVRVVVYVPEIDAAIVHQGLPIELAFQSASGATVSGTIARTSWSLEPESRTLRVEVDVPNSGGHIRPGMYVYARIGAQTPEVWTLPVSAVQKQGDAMIAFRVVDGKFQRTSVKVGLKDEKRVHVRQWQDPATASQWKELTGEEEFAESAAGLTDGQPRAAVRP